jgi:hypothetical protein
MTSITQAIQELSPTAQSRLVRYAPHHDVADNTRLRSAIIAQSDTFDQVVKQAEAMSHKPSWLALILPKKQATLKQQDTEVIKQVLGEEAVKNPVQFLKQYDTVVWSPEQRSKVPFNQQQLLDTYYHGLKHFSSQPNAPQYNEARALFDLKQKIDVAQQKGKLGEDWLRSLFPKREANLKQADINVVSKVLGPEAVNNPAAFAEGFYANINNPNLSTEARTTIGNYMQGLRQRVENTAGFNRQA